MAELGDVVFWRIVMRPGRPLPLLRVQSLDGIRKQPDPTEYQRGIVTRAAEGRSPSGAVRGR